MAIGAPYGIGRFDKLVDDLLASYFVFIVLGLVLGLVSGVIRFRPFN